MADNAETKAEKAYSEASAATPVKAKPLVESLKADAAKGEDAKVAAPKAEAGKVEAPKAPVAKTVAPTAKATKQVARKAGARKPAARKAAAAKTAPVKSAPKPRVAKAPIARSTPNTTIKKLKETIMASKTPEFTNDYTNAFGGAMTDTMSSAVTEMQTRAQAAYEKAAAGMTEMTDFARGNVEAMVESGKAMAEGMQAMGKTYADEAKSAYETMTADLKEMAAVKSPTELFQLQGKIMRRNFDAMVAVGTKNTDAALKLANDVAAPISGRVNVAAEKLSKVA